MHQKCSHKILEVRLKEFLPITYVKQVRGVLNCCLNHLQLVIVMIVMCHLQLPSSFFIRFSDLISENEFIFKAQSTWSMTKSCISTNNWTVWWEKHASGFSQHFLWLWMLIVKWLGWFDTLTMLLFLAMHVLLCIEYKFSKFF